MVGKELTEPNACGHYIRRIKRFCSQRWLKQEALTSISQSSSLNIESPLIVTDPIGKGIDDFKEVAELMGYKIRNINFSERSESKVYIPGHKSLF